MRTQKKSIIVNVEQGLHEKIRRYVFKHRITLAQFVREAIELRFQVQEMNRKEKAAARQGMFDR